MSVSRRDMLIGSAIASGGAALLANRKAVVTEASEDTDIDVDLRPGLEAIAYDGVADAAERLVRDEPARHALEKAGFDAFRRRPQAVPLAYALSRLPW